MKRVVNSERYLCDHCKKVVDGEEYLFCCLNCGIEFCFNCADKKGKRYDYSVYFSGESGFYCKSCDNSLTISGSNELYNSYRLIEKLRIELKSWQKDFERRETAASNKIKELFAKVKKA